MEGHEILKLLLEKIGKIVEDGGVSNYFRNRTPIAWEVRMGMDKWNCIKLKNFCPSKQLLEPRSNAQNGEKILAR
jgi:hypothetical protein